MRGGRVRLIFRAKAIYWCLESWIKCHAAANDHIDLTAFMAASDSTWLHPRGAETSGCYVLMRAKAMLSSVD